MDKSRITIILILTSALILSLSCSNGVTRLISEIDSREKVIGPREESYSFDAPTIVSSLSAGKQNVFRLEVATPDSSFSSQLGPTPWKQADYLKVTNAFYEEVLKDTLASWDFDEFTFLATCVDASYGPQIARFHLFKINQNGGEDSRFEHFIYIEPQKGRLDLVKTEYHPNIHSPTALDLNRAMIPAESALKTAEGNGGQVFRQSVNNLCNISIQKFENDWLVQYSSDNSAFKVQIDDQTGDYKVVK